MHFLTVPTIHVSRLEQRTADNQKQTSNPVFVVEEYTQLHHKKYILSDFLPVCSFAIRLALPTYCCTHRVDAGNRLPLCEGEVDFICQVPNLINYQLQTLHLEFERTN
jgi:hypothetical protein